jgi:arylsulfatase A-like enzyme
MCCPSRASILTGLYAHHTGVLSNEPPNGGALAFDDVSTIATWLQAAGYRTGLYGKYLNGYLKLWTAPAPPYVPPGWNEWHAFKSVGYFDYSLIENGAYAGYGAAESDYSTDVLRDKAVAFIRDSVQRGERFFLYFAPITPHSPEEPAPRHVDLFDRTRPHRPPSYNEADVSDKPRWVQQQPLLTPPDQAALDRLLTKELEMLQAADEAVLAIMEELRRSGVADDTLVVFTSDNGIMLGEHRLRGKKSPYDENLHVPFVVRYPRLAPLPRRDERFALNIDLAPTFAALAGVTPPLPVDGRSLDRVLDGTEAQWRSDFLTEGFWGGGRVWASVRKQRWKYIEYPSGERELYDLATDPFELWNVAGLPGNAARGAALAARLRQIRPGWPGDLPPTY